MNASVAICPVCEKPLEKLHGNKRYHTACAYTLKKQRSKNQYAQNMLRHDPFWDNERILKQFAWGYGEGKELDPQLMEDAGFNFEFFKEKKMLNGQTVYMMQQYGFCFLKNEKIVIWKQ